MKQSLQQLIQIIKVNSKSLSYWSNSLWIQSIFSNVLPLSLEKWNTLVLIIELKINYILDLIHSFIYLWTCIARVQCWTLERDIFRLLLLLLLPIYFWRSLLI
ncbi:hypothetical protein BLOT_010099, partial [Blomia tropicalis]